MTNDVYQALKGKVGDLFGRRAISATEKLEASATREEGKVELALAFPDLWPDEAEEIRPALEKFLDAMRRDESARESVAHARIALDLDVGGDVLIDDVQDAREIDVRSRSDGDFTFRDVRMSPGRRSGNWVARRGTRTARRTTHPNRSSTTRRSTRGPDATRSSPCPAAS